MRISYGIIRFPLNNACEYVECIFQEPFSSCLSGLILVQPAFVRIKDKESKIEEAYSIFDVRKEVKKLRYQNYLLGNKMKKIFYGKQNKEMKFSLPALFLTGEKSM